MPERTEWLAVLCDIAMVKPIEVSMKMTADHVVKASQQVDPAPRGPNAVCELWPPKALARSADLPC